MFEQYRAKIERSCPSRLPRCVELCVAEISERWVFRSIIPCIYACKFGLLDGFYISPVGAHVNNFIVETRSKQHLTFGLIDMCNQEYTLRKKTIKLLMKIGCEPWAVIFLVTRNCFGYPCVVLTMKGGCGICGVGFIDHAYDMLMRS